MLVWLLRLLALFALVVGLLEAFGVLFIAGSVGDWLLAALVLFILSWLAAGLYESRRP